MIKNNSFYFPLYLKFQFLKFLYFHSIIYLFLLIIIMKLYHMNSISIMKIVIYYEIIIFIALNY